MQELEKKLRKFKVTIRKKYTFFWAVHGRKPLGELHPTLQLVLLNFAKEAAALDKLVMEVNTLKEICLRLPEAMEEDDIYQICVLRKIKHKNVAGSIRSFINL